MKHTVIRLTPLLATVLPLMAQPPAPPSPPTPDGIAEISQSLPSEEELQQLMKKAIASLEESPEGVVSSVNINLNYGNKFQDNNGPQTRLGVSTTPLPEMLSKHLSLAPDTGLMIELVVEGSPAEKAVLTKGVIMTKLDDQILIHPDQFMVLIRNHKDGDQVTISCIRDGKPEQVTATLEQSAPENAENISKLDDLAGKLRTKQRAFIKRLDSTGKSSTFVIPGMSAGAEEEDEKIEDISSQIDLMRKQIQALTEALKNR